MTEGEETEFGWLGSKPKRAAASTALASAAGAFSGFFRWSYALAEQHILQPAYLPQFFSSSQYQTVESQSSSCRQPRMPPARRSPGPAKPGSQNSSISWCSATHHCNRSFAMASITPPHRRLRFSNRLRAATCAPRTARLQSPSAGNGESRATVLPPLPQVHSHETNAGPILGLCPVGVVFSKLSRLLNQEDALGAPC